MKWQDEPVQGKGTSDRRQICAKEPHPAQWQGVLETLDRIPRVEADRGEDAVPHSLRRAHNGPPREPDR